MCNIGWTQKRIQRWRILQCDCKTRAYVIVMMFDYQITFKFLRNNWKSFQMIKMNGFSFDIMYVLFECVEVVTHNKCVFWVAFRFEWMQLLMKNSVLIFFFGFKNEIMLQSDKGANHKTQLDNNNTYWMTYWMIL